MNKDIETPAPRIDLKAITMTGEKNALFLEIDDRMRWIMSPGWVAGWKSEGSEPITRGLNKKLLAVERKFAEIRILLAALRDLDGKSD